VARRYVFQIEVADLPAPVRDFVEAITGMGTIESVDAMHWRFSVDDDDDFGAAERIAEMEATLVGSYVPSYQLPRRPVQVLTEREIAEAERRRAPVRRVEWSPEERVTLERGWHDPGVKVVDLAHALGRSRRSVDQAAARFGLGPKARVNS